MNALLNRKGKLRVRNSSLGLKYQAIKILVDIIVPRGVENQVAIREQEYLRCALAGAHALQLW